MRKMRMAEQQYHQTLLPLFEVRPTAPQVTEQHADIALTGLFNAHTAIINSERQAIWQRYNVMLLGNAIIFGFLAGGTRTASEMIFGIIFGIALCIAWWVITESGWRLLGTRTARALQFQWSGLNESINPFEISIAYGHGSVAGMIYRVAFLVIELFMAGHLFLAIHQFFIK